LLHKDSQSSTTKRYFIEIAKSKKKRSEVTQYEEHLNEEVIDAGIKSFLYYRGTLYISSTNPDDAFIRFGDNSGEKQIIYSNPFINAMGGSLKDILIPGKIFRNRAIHGDTVAVQLLPENEWTSPSSVVK
jgi:exoribonuclease R